MSFMYKKYQYNSKSKKSKKNKKENEEIYSNIDNSSINNKMNQSNRTDSILKFDDDENLPEEINLNPLHKFSNNLIAKTNSLSDMNLFDLKKSKFINNANKNLIDVDINENDEEAKGDLINSSKDDISENKSDIVFIDSNSSKFFNKYNNKKVDDDEYICNKEEMLKKSVDKSEESSSYDITRELSFHKEQLPDLINKL